MIARPCCAGSCNIACATHSPLSARSSPARSKPADRWNMSPIISAAGWKRSPATNSSPRPSPMPLPISSNWCATSYLHFVSAMTIGSRSKGPRRGWPSMRLGCLGWQCMNSSPIRSSSVRYRSKAEERASRRPGPFPSEACVSSGAKAGFPRLWPSRRGADSGANSSSRPCHISSTPRPCLNCGRADCFARSSSR